VLARSFLLYGIRVSKGATLIHKVKTSCGGGSERNNLWKIAERNIMRKETGNAEEGYRE